MEQRGMRKIISIPLYPYVTDKKITMKNKVLLGVGGNIGDCKRRFSILFRQIRKDKRFCILSTSPIYINPPFGYLEQNDFYNATIQLATNQSVIEVFRMIFYWERRFNRPRKRAFANSPRTLDIDLLWFNEIKINYPYLHIPHKEWDRRESVLIPLGLQTIL